MNLRAQLSIAFGLCFAIIALEIALTQNISNQTFRANQELRKDIAPVLRSVQLMQNVNRELHLMGLIRITGVQGLNNVNRTAAIIEVELPNLSSELNRLVDVIDVPETWSSQLTAIQARIPQILTDFQTLEQLLNTADDYSDSVKLVTARTLVDQQITWYVREVDQRLKLLEMELVNYTERAHKNLELSIKKISNVIWVTGTIGILLCLLIATKVTKSILYKVGALIEGTAVVASGDFDSRIELDDDDELGKLAIAFNGMTRKLAESASQQQRQLNEIAKARESLELTVVELERVNKSMDSFVYRVSHDLKAPVISLMSMIKLLKEHVKIAEGLETTIMANIERLANQFQVTITDLLALSRVEKNLDEEIEWIDLQQFSEQIKLELKTQLEESKAMVEIDFTNIDRVQFSRVNLKSIFTNLLSNAIKYRSPDRIAHVQIVMSIMNTGELSVVFTDNGIGIDMDRHGHKVFSMFKRFHDHVEGTGVGLYMVKAIVENAGGTIQLNSEKGKGTTVMITLPELVIAPN